MTEMTVKLPSVDKAEAAHMEPLNVRERAYVYALVALGADEVKAALAAGYGRDSPTHANKMNAASVAVHRLSRTPRVIAAIRAEAELRLTSGALLATEALLAMVKDPLSKNHFKAVDRLLGQSGLVVATKHEVSVTHSHTASDAEIMDRIRRAADALGNTPQVKALLDQAGVIDAEFTVIEEPLASVDGLEDLL